MKDLKTFYQNYDLDSAAFQYGAITGTHQGFGGVKTTGASVTIDAVVAGSAPFAPLLVGDYVRFQIGETSTSIRKVLTKPSNDQITISGATINLGTGTAAWYFMPFRIGTTAAFGGHSTEAYSRAWIVFEIPTLVGAPGVDYVVEVKGRYPSATWAPSVSIPPVSITAAGNKVLELQELIGSVRVGLKATTGFAGTDDISVFLVGNPGAQVW